MLPLILGLIRGCLQLSIYLFIYRFSWLHPLQDCFLHTTLLLMPRLLLIHSSLQVNTTLPFFPRRMSSLSEASTLPLTTPAPLLRICTASSPRSCPTRLLLWPLSAQLVLHLPIKILLMSPRSLLILLLMQRLQRMPSLPFPGQLPRILTIILPPTLVLLLTTSPRPTLLLQILLEVAGYNLLTIKLSKETPIIMSSNIKEKALAIPNKTRSSRPQEYYSRPRFLIDSTLHLVWYWLTYLLVVMFDNTSLLLAHSNKLYLQFSILSSLSRIVAYIRYFSKPFP